MKMDIISNEMFTLIKCMKYTWEEKANVFILFVTLKYLNKDQNITLESYYNFSISQIV